MSIIEVQVPQLSESVAEGTLATWKKKIGDAIARDEILIDIETDKVVLEVPSPGAGVLVEIIKADGETVVSGELLAQLLRQLLQRPPRLRRRQLLPLPRLVRPARLPARSLMKRVLLRLTSPVPAVVVVSPRKMLLLLHRRPFRLLLLRRPLRSLLRRLPSIWVTAPNSAWVR